MERYLDVLRNLISLSDTSIESLESISMELEQGNKENGLAYMIDFADAFYHMVKSIQQVSYKEWNQTLYNYTVQVNESLEEILSSWEWSEYGIIIAEIRSMLIPKYLIWQKSLQNCFQKYLVS
jgi:hypothetical protein